MMRKVLTLILILTLIISTATTVAFADPWKNESGNFPPGIAKKFLDIDGYKWAEKAIEKMAEKGVIKGIGEGRFAPQSSVTKLEAIVMALRVMGKDDAAQEYLTDIKVGKKKLKFKDYLQEWAYGYVALAEEEGILDDADILYFKLNDPATRHEVAKYLVRAMGNEDEAQDHMDADLDFKDASFVPQGSVGYVYVADKEKIITGYEDGTFRPFNAVTRAEMAVMVDRLDGTVNDNDESYETYRGEVTKIDRNYQWMDIETNDDEERFNIADDVKVIFEDDEEDKIEDLAVGDEVKIKVNKDDEIVSIEVDRDLEITEYSGSISKIDVDDDVYEFSIYTSNRVIEFKTDEDFEVQFDDEEGTVEDLRIGDKVEVAIEDDEVTEIIVDRDIDEDLVNGIIFDLYADEMKIALKNNSNNQIKIYTLDDDVIIYLNDQRARLSNLKKEDWVGLQMDNEKVIKIKAYR